MTHRDRYRKDDPDRKFLQSREWRERLRPAQLLAMPRCEHCLITGRLTAAEEVDHIVRPMGDKRLQRDPENFQSLCKSHHQRKSLWERRADGKPLRIAHSVTGWPIELPRGCVE